MNNGDFDARFFEICIGVAFRYWVCQSQNSWSCSIMCAISYKLSDCCSLYWLRWSPIAYVLCKIKRKLIKRSSSTISLIITTDLIYQSSVQVLGTRLQDLISSVHKFLLEVVEMRVLWRKKLVKSHFSFNRFSLFFVKLDFE